MVFKRSGSSYIGIRRILLLGTWLFCLSPHLYAQNNNGAEESLTLKQCIEYAMKHQPMLNQAQINISITRLSNAIALSGWLPQVNFSAGVVHYEELPTTFVPNPAGGAPTQEQSGIVNTSIPGLSVTQAIFSPALLYAAKSAPLYVQGTKLITDSSKINLVASVSKAFYNLLLTIEQIGIIKEDTIRLSKNYTDAYHQYVGGIVDETDYEEAAITLNNSKAQLKQAIENVVPQYANLKLLMGYPPEKQFNISFDTLEMMRDINYDTTRQLKYENRIEYQQFAVSRELQDRLINYYRLSFLPTISAYYNYNYEFENNTFSNLYVAAYPNSVLGLSLTLPIFTGFARLENVRKAKLQRDIIDWGGVELKSQIYLEYTTALAGYKSNLYNLYILQKNVTMAKRVYYVVDLQYKQGIVPYLNVITAESNLITSEVGYTNALFQTLSSKIDLEKAMGEIAY